MAISFSLCCNSLVSEQFSQDFSTRTPGYGVHEAYASIEMLVTYQQLCDVCLDCVFRERLTISDNKSLWCFRVVVFDSDDGSVYDVWVSSKNSFELSRRNLPAAHCDLVNELFFEQE